MKHKAPSPKSRAPARTADEQKAHQLRTALADAGYSRVEDIALITPKNFSDETKVTPIAQTEDKSAALIEVKIINRKLISGRSNKLHLRCDAEDPTGKLSLFFVNFEKWQYVLLEPNKTVRVFGKIKRQNTRNALFVSISMVQPLIRPAAAKLADSLTGIYPTIKKINGKLIGPLVVKCARAVAAGEDQLPEQFCNKHKLLPLSENLRLLHRPSANEQHLHLAAIKMLKLREWLAYLTVARQEYRAKVVISAPQLVTAKPDLAKFTKQLEFELTAGQLEAIEQIQADLSTQQAMRRLLHGDVGCGKTIVAAYACWLTLAAGHTAAIMAPTEILARQHFRRLEPLFTKLGYPVEILVGAAAKNRKQVMERLRKNPVALIIGTHALFQKSVDLTKLALVVIDEQHRFGTKQRHSLAAKGNGVHVLMMSATPIPRSMILGLFSNLDVSRIKDRPQQSSIRTMLLRSDRADELLEILKREKLQTFWVCPLISKSDKLSLRAAEEEYQWLKEKAPELNPLLIHSKQTSEQKVAASTAFENCETKLLVATTIIEVGIDAPEADIIVISNSERFGLSQLHQMRGRVGRSNKRGFCALMYSNNTTDIALTRLKIMYENTDGFAIAQEDLKLRGPGDIAGTRQSGMSKYKFADPATDLDILEQIPAMVDELLEFDPQAAKRHVKFWLGKSTFDQNRAAAKSANRPPAKNQRR